jgi:hypothetical protein
MAPTAKIAGGLAKLGGAGEKVEGFARAVGGFAGYEALTEAARLGRRPTGEEAVGAAAQGALMGGVMHGSGQLASWALRGLFRTPAKALDPEGRDLVTALKDFGKKNKILPVKGETGTSYGERLLDGWNKAGHPGAERMPIRKLIGLAIKGGIEGTGLTNLDAQFREDLYGEVLKGNFEHLDRVIEKFAGTALGVAAFSHPLKDIPAQQRKVSSKEVLKATVEAQAPQEPVQGPERNVRSEVMGKLRTDIEGRLPPVEPVQGPERNPRAEVLGKLRQDIEQRLPPIEGVDPVDVANVVRLGWEPTQGERFPRAEGNEIPLSTPLPAGRGDVDRREFMAQQAREFPEGVATVEVGANVARQALGVVAQGGPIGKQLRTLLESGKPGQVSFTTDEARKFIDYHARLARKRAGGENAEAEQPRLQALDSLAEKLVEAFGLGKEVPRGETREGTPPGRPQKPLGEPFRPEVSAEPEAREGPDEGAGGVEMPPRKPKPKGGPGEERQPAVEMELPGTDFSYTLEDGQGWASPNLEDLLGVDTPMPAKEFSDLLHRASLLSAMDSRILLPGTLVSADGIVAEAGQGDSPGVMRTIRLGEVLQAPLSPARSGSLPRPSPPVARTRLIRSKSGRWKRSRVC